MNTQASAYFHRDPERDEFYRVFYKTCRQFNVVWSTATPEVKAFIEEATRVAYEQQKGSQRGSGRFYSTVILFKCRLIVVFNFGQQIDHQLTTDGIFYCRWSVFIVDTLFYIDCAMCGRTVQNQQEITIYHQITRRVVVLRQLRHGRF